MANVLFLEAPACVGLSYDDNDNCSTGDDETSLGNYLALQDFFKNKVSIQSCTVVLITPLQFFNCKDCNV